MGISDNNIRISFDYKYPDEAVLVVFTTNGGGYLYGDQGVNIRKVITGKKAIGIYSELSGKPIEKIQKDAGYTKYDES